MSRPVPLHERITVIEVSASTTQHSLAICLDGKSVVAVDNSWRGGFGEGGRPYRGDYTDWMLHRSQDVSDMLKVWFVQRFMRFTTAIPGAFFERDFDREAARLSAVERANGGIFADESRQEPEVERERVRA